MATGAAIMARRLLLLLLGDATAGEHTGTPRLPYRVGRPAWRLGAPRHLRGGR